MKAYCSKFGRKLVSPLSEFWFGQVLRGFCLALSLMGASGFMEKLDSFWFFSNVLSSGCQAMASDTDERATQFSLNLSPEPEVTKLLTHVGQNQWNQMPGSRVGSAAETGAQIAKAEILEVLPPGKDETRRRRRKRSFTHCLDHRRRVHGESGVQVKGLAVDVVCGIWAIEEASGCPWFFSPQHVKMPPLSDGMAMKQHLKSWAYAVACTVR